MRGFSPSGHCAQIYGKALPIPGCEPFSLLDLRPQPPRLHEGSISVEHHPAGVSRARVPVLVPPFFGGTEPALSGAEEAGTLTSRPQKTKWVPHLSRPLRKSLP
jgi:hypothetical protein